MRRGRDGGGEDMTSAVVLGLVPASRVASVGLYCRVSGVALAALAALGFLLVAVGMGGLLDGFLAFDTAHNVLHALLAAITIGLGFGEPRVVPSKAAARALGGAYAALALAGFISGSLFGAGPPLGLHLEVGENLVHLVLGAWGLYAGFAA